MMLLTMEKKRERVGGRDCYLTIGARGPPTWLGDLLCDVYYIVRYQVRY